MARGGDTSSSRRSGYGPDFQVLNGGGVGAALQVSMRKGDEIKAESDALVTMSGRVKLGSAMEGGLWRSLLRSGLSDESVYVQTLKARADDQDVLIAPENPGDVVLLDVGPKEFMLAKGAFLAADTGVEVEPTTQWDMRKMAFGGGLFVIRVSGLGTLAVNSTGSLVHYVLEPGERRSVDNGHVLAWTASMKYEVAMATKSVFTSLTSGEGMMCHFEGPGELYVQTHKPQMLIGGPKGAKRVSGAHFLVCLFAAVMCLVFLVVILVAVSLNADEVRVERFSRRRY